MVAFLERWIGPLKRRVMLMIGKAVLSVITDNSGFQTAQINLGNDNVMDDVKRVQDFGFTSFPENGAQAIVLFIGGNREHPIIIKADDVNYRPTLSQGSSAMYNSSGIKITLIGPKAIVDASDIELGNGATKKLVNDTFVTLFNAHVHTDPLSGVTGTPTVPMTPANLTFKTKAD